MTKLKRTMSILKMPIIMIVVMALALGTFASEGLMPIFPIDTPYQGDVAYSETEEWAPTLWNGSFQRLIVGDDVKSSFYQGYTGVRLASETADEATYNVLIDIYAVRAPWEVLSYNQIMREAPSGNETTSGIWFIQGGTDPVDTTTPIWEIGPKVSGTVGPSDAAADYIASNAPWSSDFITTSWRIAWDITVKKDEGVQTLGSAAINERHAGGSNDVVLQIVPPSSITPPGTTSGVVTIPIKKIITASDPGYASETEFHFELKSGADVIGNATITAATADGNKDAQHHVVMEVPLEKIALGTHNYTLTETNISGPTNQKSGWKRDATPRTISMTKNPATISITNSTLVFNNTYRTPDEPVYRLEIPFAKRIAGAGWPLNSRFTFELKYEDGPLEYGPWGSRFKSPIRERDTIIRADDRSQDEYESKITIDTSELAVGTHTLSVREVKVEPNSTGWIQNEQVFRFNVIKSDDESLEWKEVLEGGEDHGVTIEGEGIFTFVNPWMLGTYTLIYDLAGGYFQDGRPTTEEIIGAHTITGWSNAYYRFVTGPKGFDVASLEKTFPNTGILISPEFFVYNPEGYIPIHNDGFEFLGWDVVRGLGSTVPWLSFIPWDQPKLYTDITQMEYGALELRARWNYPEVTPSPSPTSSPTPSPTPAPTQEVNVIYREVDKDGNPIREIEDRVKDDRDHVLSGVPATTARPKTPDVWSFDFHSISIDGDSSPKVSLNQDGRTVTFIDGNNQTNIYVNYQSKGGAEVKYVESRDGAIFDITGEINAGRTNKLQTYFGFPFGETGSRGTNFNVETHDLIEGDYQYFIDNEFSEGKWIFDKLDRQNNEAALTALLNNLPPMNNVQNGPKTNDNNNMFFEVPTTLNTTTGIGTFGTYPNAFIYGYYSRFNSTITIVRDVSHPVQRTEHFAYRIDQYPSGSGDNTNPLSTTYAVVTVPYNTTRGMQPVTVYGTGRYVVTELQNNWEFDWNHALHNDNHHYADPKNIGVKVTLDMFRETSYAKFDGQMKGDLHPHYKIPQFMRDPEKAAPYNITGFSKDFLRTTINK